MSNVIETDRFKKAETNAKFGRMLKKGMEWKEEVERDPWPYIDRLNERTISQQILIDNIEKALRPPLPLHSSELGVDDFKDLGAESFERVQNALKLIYKFRDEKFSS